MTTARSEVFCGDSSVGRQARLARFATTASGNGAPIGGVKVTTAQWWFAARPSGTENVYKLYAESFRGSAHLGRIQEDAQAIVRRALAAVRP
jgi:phosphoglucomutase